MKINANPEGVSWFSAFYLGRGVNADTGKVFETAIEGDPIVEEAKGQTTVFQLLAISNTEELTSSLNLNVSASLNLGNAGMSVESSFCNRHTLNSYYTYGLVRVIVTNPTQTLRNPKFKPEAKELVERGDWSNFFAAYGSEYISGKITGGCYYALIEIQTRNEEEQEETKNKLSLSYGSFETTSKIETTFKEITKDMTTNIFVTQSGGSGDVQVVSWEEMVERARKFAEVVKQNPAPIRALTTDYKILVAQLGLAFDDLQIKSQNDTLRDLGQEYLRLRDYKANLEFVKEHFTEFDDFRGLDLEGLKEKENEIQESLDSTAKEIDEIVNHARKCATDTKECKTYVKKIQPLKLPKIGGKLMKLKQMEEELIKLREEVNKSKLPIGTVISSLLTYLQFTRLPNFDSNEWLEANGQKVPQDSEYSKITGSDTVPDLSSLNGYEILEFTTKQLKNGGEVSLKDNNGQSWYWITSLRDIEGNREYSGYGDESQTWYEQAEDNFQVYLEDLKQEANKQKVVARGRTYAYGYAHDWSKWKDGTANVFGIGYKKKPKIHYYIKIN